MNYKFSAVIILLTKFFLVLGTNGTSIKQSQTFRSPAFVKKLRSLNAPYRRSSEKPNIAKMILLKNFLELNCLKENLEFQQQLEQRIKGRSMTHSNEPVGKRMPYRHIVNNYSTPDQKQSKLIKPKNFLDGNERILLTPIGEKTIIYPKHIVRIPTRGNFQSNRHTSINRTKQTKSSAVIKKGNPGISINTSVGKKFLNSSKISSNKTDSVKEQTKDWKSRKEQNLTDATLPKKNFSQKGQINITSLGNFTDSYTTLVIPGYKGNKFLKFPEKLKPFIFLNKSNFTTPKASSIFVPYEVEEVIEENVRVDDSSHPEYGARNKTILVKHKYSNGAAESTKINMMSNTHLLPSPPPPPSSHLNSMNSMGLLTESIKAILQGLMNIKEEIIPEKAEKQNEYLQRRIGAHERKNSLPKTTKFSVNLQTQKPDLKKTLSHKQVEKIVENITDTVGKRNNSSGFKDTSRIHKLSRTSPLPERQNQAINYETVLYKTTPIPSKLTTELKESNKNKESISTTLPSNNGKYQFSQNYRFSTKHTDDTRRTIKEKIARKLNLTTMEVPQTLSTFYDTYDDKYTTPKKTRPLNFIRKETTSLDNYDSKHKSEVNLKSSNPVFTTPFVNEQEKKSDNSSSASSLNILESVPTRSAVGKFDESTSAVFNPTSYKFYTSLSPQFSKSSTNSPQTTHEMPKFSITNTMNDLVNTTENLTTSQNIFADRLSWNKDYTNFPLLIDLMPTTATLGSQENVNQNGLEVEFDVERSNTLTHPLDQRRSDILINETTEDYRTIPNLLSSVNYTDILKSNFSKSNGSLDKIIPIVPLLINELRSNNIKSQEITLLSRAYKNYWPQILALSQIANLDLLPLMQMKTEEDLKNVLKNYSLEYTQQPVTETVSTKKSNFWDENNNPLYDYEDDYKYFYQYLLEENDFLNQTKRELKHLSKSQKSKEKEKKIKNDDVKKIFKSIKT